MTLTEILKIKEKYLQYEDMRALDFAEKRWKEEGCPTERWKLINFLEKMLQELKVSGLGYPKVLLLRKKELQRRTFTPLEPTEVQASNPTGCIKCDPDGFTFAGTPCSCPRGDTAREKLRKLGMQI